MGIGRPADHWPNGLLAGLAFLPFGEVSPAAGPVERQDCMAGSDRDTQGKIKAYLDERRRLVKRWQQEERKRWPKRGRLTPKELEELFWAEHAHDKRLRAIARQHFGQRWESGHIRNIKTPAELWAYIKLVGLPVVVAQPAAARREIDTVLEGFDAAGLPTPDEPAWQNGLTRAEAVRVLRRLADSIYSEPIGPPEQTKPGKTVAEYNIEARKYLKKNPNAGPRELRNALRCGMGTVYKLPAYQAVAEKRKKGCKPKAVSLTKPMADAVTKADGDGELAKLVREQRRDMRTQKVSSRERL